MKISGFTLSSFPALALATETILRSSNPAQSWMDTYPIGNGRLGATAFGSIDNDVIIFSEDSFYNGGFQNRVNAKSTTAFPQVRQLMDSGKLTEASDLWLSGMVGTPTGVRKTEPAGYLNVTTGHDSKSATDYSRFLDISTGVANTSYTYGGIKYFRSQVASNPDNVIAIQYTASAPKSLSMSFTLDRRQGGMASTGSDGGLWLGSTGADDKSFTTSQYAFVTTTGGSLSSSGRKITVTNADSITVVWDAETIYYYPTGSSTYNDVLKNRIKNAAKKGFAAIYDTAVADHSALYNRVSFSLGSSQNTNLASQSTSQRIAALRSASNFDQDVELLTLGYNYGRYLLIASSRPGSLPPNLQGVWLQSYNPPWGGHYTININLEMNYWLADINGLPETLEPLWSLMGRMQTRGRAVAQGMYNLPGWVCHHNTDLWGDCAPDGSGTQWTAWPMGGAWMLHTAIEHFRYTQDKSFASDVALPLISDAVTFYKAFSVQQNGSWVTYPSASPELPYFIPKGMSTEGKQTGLDKSPQSDRALMYLLFAGFVEISKAVGSTDGVSDAEDYLSKLKGPDTNPSTGLLREWSQDFTSTELGHRHFSPCIGLYPGNQYSPLINTTVTTAASKLISQRMSRGGGGQGWSRIWSSMLYSRMFDGTNAANQAFTLMRSQMYSNLWSITSNVFQADANFGLSAAVNEMFLQSQTNGIIHLGPALPPNTLKSGKFSGWKVRGGFTVSAEWSNATITGASIVSNSGAKLSIRVQGGRFFKVNGAVYNGPIDTTSGQTYTVTF